MLWAGLINSVHATTPLVLSLGSSILVIRPRHAGVAILCGLSPIDRWLNESITGRPILQTGDVFQKRARHKRPSRPIIGVETCLIAVRPVAVLLELTAIRDTDPDLWPAQTC